jgi:hypothetical protein
VPVLASSKRPIRRAGEGTLLVAEHLALHQVLGDRGAIHAHEGAVAPRAPAVDRRGHQLLPRARLAHQEHARIGRRYAGDHLAHLLHLRARSHHVARERVVLAQRLRFAPCGAQLERRAQRQQHALGRERLLEEGERAELRRLHGVAQSRAPAHHHHGDLRIVRAQRGERRHPVHASGHHEVEQHRVGLVLHGGRHPRGAVGGLAYRKSFAAEQRADHPADVGLVVDDQDLSHSASSPPPGVRTTASS